MWIGRRARAAGSRGPLQWPYDAIYHYDNSRRTDAAPGPDFGSARLTATPRFKAPPLQAPQHPIINGPGHLYGGRNRRSHPVASVGSAAAR